MRLALAILLLAQTSVFADEWVTGQAPRAVLGQSSFSSRLPNLTPVSLAVLDGRLYAADVNGRVLAFDVTNFNAGTGPCASCIEEPLSSVDQLVSPGAARFARSGTAVAVADPDNSRLLLFNGQQQRVVLKTTVSSVAIDSRYLYAGDLAAHRVSIWKLPVTEDRAPDFSIGSVGRPAALTSDGENLYVGDTANHRILVFQRSDQALAPDAVANAATQTAGPLAPGTLISVHADSVTDLLLDGKPIPVLSITGRDITAQLPYDLSYASSAVLWGRWTDRDGQAKTTNPISIKLLSAAPGLFCLPGSTAAMAFHDASGPVSDNDQAQPGETIKLWATGLGAILDTEQPAAGVPWSGIDAAVRAPLTAVANGEPLEIVSAYLTHGAIGVYEIRLRLPADSVPGERLLVSVGQNGVSSNTVSFPFNSKILN